jgi:hypothetical protein
MLLILYDFNIDKTNPFELKLGERYYSVCAPRLRMINGVTYPTINMSGNVLAYMSSNISSNQRKRNRKTWLRVATKFCMQHPRTVHALCLNKWIKNPSCKPTLVNELL